MVKPSSSGGVRAATSWAPRILITWICRVKVQAMKTGTWERALLCSSRGSLDMPTDDRTL